MPLTAIAIQKAKVSDKTVRMFDGGGLYLELIPTGGKWWRLKLGFTRFSGHSHLTSKPPLELGRADVTQR